MKQQDNVCHEDQPITPRSVNGCHFVGENLFSHMNIFGDSNRSDSIESFGSNDYDVCDDENYDNSTGLYTFIEQGCWTDSGLADADNTYQENSGLAGEVYDEILKKRKGLKVSLPQYPLIESDISDSRSSSTSQTPLYMKSNRVSSSFDPDAYEHLSDILSTKNSLGFSRHGNEDSHAELNYNAELQKLRTIHETEESDSIKMFEDGINKRQRNIFKCLFNTFKTQRRRKNSSGSGTSSDEVVMKTVQIMNSPSGEDDDSVYSSIIVFDPRA